MANDKDIIKSVRVRKSHKLKDDFTSDIKVTISKSGLFNNKRKVVGESDNNSIWPAITYDMNGRYEYYDDKAFLDDFISTNAKLEGSEYVQDFTNKSQDTKKYIIAQDPWNDYYSTKYRSFSFDHYFLSNGATVVIKWLLSEYDKDRKQMITYEVGGEEWSDDKGNELDVESIPNGKNIDGTPKILKKEDIYKRVEIIDSREKGSNERLLFSWNLTSFYDEKDTSAANRAASEKIDGKIPDKWILDKIIREWTSKVPSYDGKLLVCLNSDGTVVGGSYNPTSIEDPPNSDRYVKNDWMKLEWISPINPPAKLPEPVTENNKPAGMSSSKIKLNVVLPPDFKVVVKQDTKDVKVYVGDPPKVEVPGGFIFTEEQDVLDDEYSEISDITQLNQIDDEPVGPSFDEDNESSTSTTATTTSDTTQSNVEKTVIGPGPVVGSKLTNKTGTSMINLAGHRLKPILKDLENYLNKNGYPGAKIGNNGIMRDLRASAYPSSPARATASLHGAGLAIDVTFTIPGFKWTSISDNGNLASNPALTKVISNFMKSQSDITWGASWNKRGTPSKPEEGIVLGRGITEYHHFEIRADLIPKYWEPVKDELAKFGFKPSDLKSPGEGGNLHKLMMKLLGDSSV